MRKVLIFVLGLIVVNCVNAQTVKLIPNPDTSAVGFKGYNAIVFNGGLYTTYINKNGKCQLAKYQNNQIVLINNPDTNSVYVTTNFQIFNNELYFLYDLPYSNGFSNRQLAKYNGTAISIIPPPTISSSINSYNDFGVEYANSIYVPYRDNSTYTTTILKYNGTTGNMISLPPNCGIGYNNLPFLFNNKICFQTSYNNSYKVILSYDGNNFTMSDTTNAKNILNFNSYNAFVYKNNVYIPGSTYTPYYTYGILKFDGNHLTNFLLDTAGNIDYGNSLGEYNNRLYYTSYNKMLYPSSNYLNEFDGTNHTKLANPDSGSVDFYRPVVYANKLFLSYNNTNNKRHLANYDGSQIRMINNLDPTDGGIYGYFNELNKIYLGYGSSNGKVNVLSYNDTAYTLHQNPDSGAPYGFGKSYINMLFLNYKNAQGKYQLAYLSDSTLPAPCNPSIGIGTTATSMCYGTKVTFTAITLNAGTTPIYQWKKNNVNVGANSNVYADSSLNQNDSLVCYVTSVNCIGTPTAKSNTIFIYFATNRNYAYLTSYDSSGISIVDLNTNALVKRIKTLSEPISVAISPNKQIAVFTSNDGNKPIILNTLTNAIIGYLPVNSKLAIRVVFNNDGSKIYYADSIMLRVFNASNYQQVDSLIFTPGFVIYDIKFNNIGDKIYVSNTNNIFELDANTLTINKTLNLNNTTNIYNFYFLRCNKNNSRVYITGGKSTTSKYGSLIVYDNINNNIIKTLDFNTDNLDLLLQESKNKLFFASISAKKVYVLNTLNNIITDSITLLDAPFGIDSSADGNYIYVANGKYLTKINTTTNAIVQNIIVGNHLYSIGNFILQETSNCLSTKTISGNFITTLKKAVKNVNVKLSGNSSSTIVNDNLGKYNFTVVDGNYTLYPTKNNDITKANGINTTDVLFTQRHILNITKLNSAYKLIAADVNGDKNINATDVLRIKRLILGIDTTFTSATKGNRLWEFVDSAYIFPDTTNPFPFKDSISFTNLTSNKINQTFIGIKLGDVNYDWNPLVAKGVEVKPVELLYEIRNEEFQNSYRVQNPIRVNITANNFKELVAMQYALHFDNSKYEFVGIENNNLNIDFNEKQVTRNGNISFLWTDKNAVEKTLADGTELFVLVLQSTVDSRPSTDLKLTLTNDITDIAAWDKNLNEHSIILTKRATNNEQPETINELVIYPNPTKGIVNINCSNAKQIMIIDVMGNTIKQIKNITPHQTINIKQFAKGMYIIKAIMNNGIIKTEKLLVE